jgi:hypothetical protein
MSAYVWAAAGAALALALVGLGWGVACQLRFRRFVRDLGPRVANIESAQARLANRVRPSSAPSLPIPLEVRADWDDSKLDTRHLDHGETHPPVDFRNRYW